jgi:hypothetical protein
MGGGMKAVPGVENIDVELVDGTVEILQTDWTGETVMVHFPVEYLAMFVAAISSLRSE